MLFCGMALGYANEAAHKALAISARIDRRFC
jgi:hypothetical protein